MEQRLLLGVFDIIHVGHLSQIESVAGPNRTLTAAVVSDAGIRELLGTDPFLPEYERAALLGQLRVVDYSLIVGPENNWNLPAHDRFFVDASLSAILPKAGISYPHGTDVEISRQPASAKLVSASRVA